MAVKKTSATNSAASEEGFVYPRSPHERGAVRPFTYPPTPTIRWSLIAGHPVPGGRCWIAEVWFLLLARRATQAGQDMVGQGD